MKPKRRRPHPRTTLDHKRQTIPFCMLDPKTGCLIGRRPTGAFVYLGSSGKRATRVAAARAGFDVGRKR